MNIDSKRYLSEVLQPLNFDKTFEERQEHIENVLARYLNLKTVVALIGAGASIPIGYPSWNKFAEDTLKETIKNVPEKEQEIERYLGYIGDSGKEMSAQVILQESERLFAWKHNDKKAPLNSFRKHQSVSFRKIVKTYFDKSHQRFFTGASFWGKKLSYEEKLNNKNNPYVALLELPVKRFVTTNYDFEIERALLVKKKIPNNLSYEEICNLEVESENNKNFVNLTKGYSFSQKSINCNELARFPIARYEGSEYMVFHCHGRVDDMESCVVTEDDFQKWYLRDEPECIPFRQALDLTLSSNPILILGYGLGDLDLTRWLRIIAANRPVDKVRNPLFCVNYIPASHFKEYDGKPAKWRSEKEVQDECDALYLRYGLHVIPVYERKPKNIISDPENKACESSYTLCDKLRDIKSNWRNWWNGILMKPKFRTTPIHNFILTEDEKQTKSYYHYRLFFNKQSNDDQSNLNHNQHIVKGIYDELEKKLDEILQVKPLKNKSRQSLDSRDKKNNSANKNLAVVVGDGGSGKSWSVQKYLRDREDDPNHKFWGNWKFVFWSSYYANDVLTGIDRLIEFFEYDPQNKISNEKKDFQGDRFDKLRHILKTHNKTIIVFDGIEKLLNPTKEKTDGESISPEVKEFFQILSEHGFKKSVDNDKKQNNLECKIILTTQLFPIDVLPIVSDPDGEKNFSEIKNETEQARKEYRNNVEIIAPKCWSEDLLEEDEFKLIPFEDEILRKEKLSSLCSLVDGHIFCIALIRGILEGLSSDKIDPLIEKSHIEDKFDYLERDIANTPIDRRIYRVIREAIRSLDRNDTYKNSNKIIKRFIERISLFMHPTGKEIAQVCFNEVLKDIEKSTSNKLSDKTKEYWIKWFENFSICLNPSTVISQAEINFEQLLSDLVERNLLQQVYLEIDNNVVGYVVHPLVRNYIYQTIHKSLFTSLPSLQLPGFTSAMEVVDPGSGRGVKTTKNLFQALCDKANAPFYDKNLESNELEIQRKISLDSCRGAFSILRSRFCANTVTRWGDYREYLAMLLNLYDTAKRVSKETWQHNEPTKLGTNLSIDLSSPLYVDELAWIYNEIGLASISMGNLLNATALWEQGLEISRLIDNDKDGRYLFQSEFNLGSAFIHLGKLNIAMSYLERAYEIGNRLNDPKLTSRVKAYTGLVKYLQGNLEEANQDFTESYIDLEDNPRAKSVFYCYHGELLSKLNKIEEAKEKINQSRHIGEAAHYPDLIAYSRLANASILVKEEKYEEAQSEFSFSLNIARQSKLRRLESGSLSGMSRLADKLNDSEIARQRAVESLKIANEYSLCLHQTVGLLVLGKALVKGFHRNLGIACLQSTKDLAKSQGYFLRMNEAEIELQKHITNYI